MTIVKKTVALHPLVDRAVRRLWARLIEAGLDASYSTALNLLVMLSLCSENLEDIGLDKKQCMGLMLDILFRNREDIEFSEHMVRAEEILTKKIIQYLTRKQ